MSQLLITTNKKSVDSLQHLSDADLQFLGLNGFRIKSAALFQHLNPEVTALSPDKIKTGISLYNPFCLIKEKLITTHARHPDVKHNQIGSIAFKQPLHCLQWRIEIGDFVFVRQIYCDDPAIAILSSIISNCFLVAFTTACSFLILQETLPTIFILNDKQSSDQDGYTNLSPLHRHLRPISQDRICFPYRSKLLRIGARTGNGQSPDHIFIGDIVSPLLNARIIVTNLAQYLLLALSVGTKPAICTSYRLLE